MATQKPRTKPRSCSRNANLLQQGDVLLKRICALPEGLEVAPTERVLQHGEFTGHAHRFAPDAAVTVYRMPLAGAHGLRITARDGEMYIEVRETALLTHEEHKPVSVDPGIYHVDIVREYDYEAHETMRVAD